VRRLKRKRRCVEPTLEVERATGACGRGDEEAIERKADARSIDGCRRGRSGFGFLRSTQKDAPALQVSEERSDGSALDRRTGRAFPWHVSDSIRVRVWIRGRAEPVRILSSVVYDLASTVAVRCGVSSSEACLVACVTDVSYRGVTST